MWQGKRLFGGIHKIEVEFKPDDSGGQTKNIFENVVVFGKENFLNDFRYKFC